MKKHLLVYDYDWWVLGQKARIIKKHHPNLDILSNKEIRLLTSTKGAGYINSYYEIISTLSLGLAQLLVRLNIRVDTSQIGSYNYFMKNHETYQEWRDKVQPNKHFLQKIMKPIKQFGAINPKLAQEVKKLTPEKNVNYIRQFVDTDRFRPIPSKQKRNKKEIIIGWAGNNTRSVKNHKTLYQPIVKSLQKNSNITFVEATRASRVPLKDMPAFYRSLDLLLITSSNEGGPAPALEANACGIPVLSTNVGYVQKITDPAGKFLILNSDRPNDFIKKIKFLEENRDVLQKLKRRARENIMSHWTIEKTISDWMQTLFHISI
ncbi:glycosyltransferase involved in cell wall biosynthesis [Salibacterium salarium]|uniref:glycosyltransferase family 4 protein n=1 Tax=Salibacterium salarium TaxID=284579 RepID=UPI002781458D|nr:glycosyltransferase family 4 protein [Salibacterium salarium]MDQ0300698.1 glycosyltransferase involved in cell wall biosynthesis [Salibacterium salarium]